MANDISSEEMKKLAALNMKKALGGVSDEEEEERRQLERKKALNRAVNKDYT